ncbi:MAG TPA: Gfo/Idh/MocA family oxidoreductase [Bryobacteraceae bacterium]|nr:Gfo/Idh/MocA family oxidoreductase [Bryobacteraceae bacterium]HPU71758.1 Gfo/Idh/MocA family oxidoreductase [Bryobacteraceae bacterium]
MENRRSFLKKATMGLAAAGAPAAPAPSDQFVVGVIGTGTRAYAALIPQFKFNPAFRIAALCDVYKPNLEKAAALVGGNVATYGDYRRVLDRKDIDVVVIATPDHWHCPMVIDACQAGKDIYLEKPVSNDIDMCLKAIAAVREHKRVVQVGLMQRSSAPFMEAYKEVKSGVLGKVRHVVLINPGGSAPRGRQGTAGGAARQDEESTAPPPDLDWEMFQGPAPRRPYSPQRQRGWRNYWEYGGGPLADWGVHLLDVAHWYLGVNEPARTAAAVYGWYNRPQDDRFPDTTDVSWQYRDFVVNYSSRSDVLGTYFWGDDAVLFVNRYGYTLRPVTRNWRGGGKSAPEKRVDLHDEPPNGHASFDSDCGRHILNFLACLRSRERPVCDIETGAWSTIPTLMAGLSIRHGGKTIAWNGNGAAPL